jgi:hypothetical protein
MENLEQALDSLRGWDYIGLDSEGFGVDFDDRLFALSFATMTKSYYFNFFGGVDYLGNYTPSEYVLPYDVLKELAPVFYNPKTTWFIHNASYDTQKLLLEGVEIFGDVICTKNSERILRNNLGPKDYSLSKCAERRGLNKLDIVEECITQNRLYTMVETPGKKTKTKRKHFEKVPFELLAEYAEVDAELHLKIGLSQREELYG